MLEGQRAPRELAEHGMVASSAPLFMSFNFIISFFFSSYLLISFILEFLPRKIRGLEFTGRRNLVLAHDLASAIPSLWASKVALVVRNPPGYDPWVGKIPWRTWQPTPVFLSKESRGQRSLVSCSPWSHKELHTDEVT